MRDQIALYEQGAAVEQHTYDYEPESDRLTPHRTKEEADDYRYFPEPDLVPVQPEPATVERLRERAAGAARARASFACATSSARRRADARYRRARRALGGDARRRRRAGAAANVIANQLVGAGVDPERVITGRSSRSS